MTGEECADSKILSMCSQANKRIPHQRSLAIVVKSWTLQMPCSSKPSKQNALPESALHRDQNDITHRRAQRSIA